MRRSSALRARSTKPCSLSTSIRATIVLGSIPVRALSSCWETGSSASMIMSIPKCIGCSPYSPTISAKASKEAVDTFRRRKPV
jgi:hypothetical protein